MEFFASLATGMCIPDYEIKEDNAMIKIPYSQKMYGLEPITATEIQHARTEDQLDALEALGRLHRAIFEAHCGRCYRHHSELGRLALHPIEIAG